jgi:hypothetical protein
MPRAARVLWASPYSLLGLLFAPFFRTRRVVSGVLICEGAEWPRRLGWRYRAITFGHVVLAVNELDERTLRHELAHVRQYERWGLLFPPVYLGACAAAMARGGHYYRDNVFEVAARSTADGPGGTIAT